MSTCAHVSVTVKRSLWLLIPRARPAAKSPAPTAGGFSPALFPASLDSNDPTVRDPDGPRSANEPGTGRCRLPGVAPARHPVSSEPHHCDAVYQSGTSTRWRRML